MVIRITKQGHKARVAETLNIKTDLTLSKFIFNCGVIKPS